MQRARPLPARLRALDQAARQARFHGQDGAGPNVVDLEDDLALDLRGRRVTRQHRPIASSLFVNSCRTLSASPGTCNASRAWRGVKPGLETRFDDFEREPLVDAEARRLELPRDPIDHRVVAFVSGSR